MSLPKTIVVGTDFSEQAEGAARYALELAGKLGARVHFVHGWSLPPTAAPIEMPAPFTATLAEQLAHSAEASMKALVERHRSAGVPLESTVVCRDARDAVTSTAAKVGAELIVMGTHGRTGVRRALMGSVAEGVLRHAPCAVLVVR